MGRQTEFVDKDSERLKQGMALLELAAKMRGPFLDMVIGVDRWIAFIISQHFCPEVEKRTLFLSLITNGTTISFAASINVLEKLLKLCYPDLYDEHLFKKLETLRRFRNIIAHSRLDVSKEFLAKGYTDRIRLVVYRDGKERHQIITEKDILERVEVCGKIIDALFKIHEEVVFLNIHEDVVRRVSKNSV